MSLLPFLVYPLGREMYERSRIRRKILILGLTVVLYGMGLIRDVASVTMLQD